ncbi:MAG: Arc family DNA-binding protein [Oscillospiraceae bacterium]|nr:Arc family DNA-binding protein [Oscillospiraceae bacterium]
MSNAPHKNPHHALRIPRDTMDKLKFIAAYHGRSANKEIEQLILQKIAAFEQKTAPFLWMNLCRVREHNLR